jgi:two-component system KDP operon response regulator KdpE
VTRILVVDDEPQIRRTLSGNLRARGYDLLLAETGEDGVALATQERPDLLIVDLGLPGIDGVEVVRQVRMTSTAPVIVLTVRDAEADKVQALDAGADDYVTKPFGMDELLARIRAALRRTEPAEDLPLIETDAFTVDLAGRQVLVDGEAVKLTPTEWHLVEVLARNAGRLVTHAQLLHEVWGPSYGRETNYLRVYMAQIRRKLEREPARPRHFITEPGVGYRFVA